VYPQDEENKVVDEIFTHIRAIRDLLRDHTFNDINQGIISGELEIASWVVKKRNE
jgi:hypothetical protein